MFKDNKKLVAETVFIKEALKNNLSLQEFLLLLFFDNSFDLVFDMKVIAKTINMSEDEVLIAYGNLINKKLIKVVADKDGFGKVTEKVSLDNFYNEIKSNYNNEEKQEAKTDIFSKFENTFGRTLSNIDYEIINAWMEKGFSEELILEALREAEYNGVLNLRYIDKILYEWNRKGFKTVEDVNKRFNELENTPIFESSVLDYDWLHEQ
ncbi:DnaD domain protein [bacterium]|nr:DnaD domain protein [bacterium]